MSSLLPGFLYASMPLTRVSVADFIAQTDGFAKLVYCNKQEMYTDEITEVNCRNLNRLQNLAAEDTFIVADMELTRGLTTVEQAALEALLC